MGWLDKILGSTEDSEGAVSKLSETKKCSRCGKILPLSDFPICKISKDGYATYCTSCAKKKRSKKKESEKRNSGWIYVITNPAFANDLPIDKATLTLPYKIGFTTKTVEERIKEYRAGAIWDYVIYGRVEVNEDPKTVETKLHKFLKDSHINTLSSSNEWYFVALDDVKQMLVNLGYPGGTWLSTYTLPNDYKEHIVNLHT